MSDNWCGFIVLTDHPKPELLTTRQIIKYTLQGIDIKRYILDTS